MPSYTFRSVGTADKQTTSVTPGTCAGLTTGDLMLIHACQRNNARVLNSIPTGWTDLSPHINDTYNYLLARIADGTAADNPPTLTWNGSGTISAQMCCFFGNVYTDLTTIVHASADESANGAGASGNDIQYNTLTVSLANCLIIARGMHNKTATGDYTPTNAGVNSLAGFTQIDQMTYNASVFSQWWGYQQQTTATTINSVIQTRNTPVETLQQSSLFIALKTASTATAAAKQFINYQQCLNG